MAIRNKKFNEVDYSRFERDLLSVLKDDPEHKVDFDGKLVFFSRQHNCLLAAADVHWDEELGDIVLVGAFKSGQPVQDETKNYPSFKQRVSVPLKECFEDLKASSGMEMRLVSKAKKAVLEKYYTPLVKMFRSRGLFDDAVMRFSSLEMGKFYLGNSEVNALALDEEGNANFICSNSFSLNFRMEVGKVSLKEIQTFCSDVSCIGEKLKEAADVYTETMQKLRPDSKSYSEYDDIHDKSKALVAVYDAGFPLRIVDSVARFMMSSNVFDRSKHTAEEIGKMVNNYRKTGVLEHPERKIEKKQPGMRM